MLIMDLLIPATMIGFGKLFLNKAPHTINYAFGYRTAMSMKNQDAWQFAHHYCGKVWLRMGWILVPFSIVPLLFVFGKDIDTISYVGSAVTFLQVVPLVGSIIPAEIALKMYLTKMDGEKGMRRI